MLDLQLGLIEAFEAAASHECPLSRIRAADRLGCERVEHGLLTAMVYDSAAMTVQRIYSSSPLDYPVGGRKPKRNTAWGQQVLLEGRRFEGEGEGTIREHFTDHEVILGLGLRSVINVPILLRGRCVGTLNWLWTEEALTSMRIEMARVFALLATPDWVDQPMLQGPDEQD